MSLCFMGKVVNYLCRINPEEYKTHVYDQTADTSSGGLTDLLDAFILTQKWRNNMTQFVIYIINACKLNSSNQQGAILIRIN